MHTYQMYSWKCEFDCGVHRVWVYHFFFRIDMFFLQVSTRIVLWLQNQLDIIKPQCLVWNNWFLVNCHWIHQSKNNTKCMMSSIAEWKAGEQQKRHSPQKKKTKKQPCNNCFQFQYAVQTKDFNVYVNCAVAVSK